MTVDDAGRLQTVPPGPVSVVIPTYNRVEQLERVLGAYLKQSRIKEVIVVDDASTDGTPGLLKDWAARDDRLRALRLEETGTQATGRNAGAEVATGDYVFFGEDDYEPAAGEIATLLEHMGRTGADLIAGRRINVRPGESHEEALLRVSGYSDPLIERWAMVGNHHVDTQEDVRAPLLDSCALIRKEVFQRVAFDTGFEGNGWREESDFQIGALEAGFRLVHCPHTLGFHSPNGVGKGSGGSRERSRLNYELWVIRNNARFLRKHWRFLKSGGCEFRVARWPELTVALQVALRALRAVRHVSRLSGWRVDLLASLRVGRLLR